LFLSTIFALFRFFFDGFCLFDAYLCQVFLVSFVFLFLMNFVVLILVFVNRFKLHSFFVLMIVAVFLMLVFVKCLLLRLIFFFLMNIVVLIFVSVNRFGLGFSFYLMYVVIFRLVFVNRFCGMWSF
jgi:hypothetical protein